LLVLVAIPPLRGLASTTRNLSTFVRIHRRKSASA
jgi:hypothetical protein